MSIALPPRAAMPICGMADAKINPHYFINRLKEAHMQISQSDDGKHGLFRLQDGDNSAGEMKYTWAGPTMFIIDSTHVDDAYRGQCRRTL